MAVRRYGFLLIFISAVLVIAGTAYCCVHLYGNPWKAGILQVHDSVSGRMLGKWPLEASGEFSIEFIHSVNQSPVRETFQVKDKKIWLLNVRFHSYGAGVQSELGDGQILSRDGDAIIISGYNASYSRLNYLVGTVTDHVLYIDNEMISLQKLAGIAMGKNGGTARISIQYK